MRFFVTKYSHRSWAVWERLEPNHQLVCVTLYRKGANEVARRLNFSLPPFEPAYGFANN
jgi:hypothetical protein